MAPGSDMRRCLASTLHYHLLQGLVSTTRGLCAKTWTILHTAPMKQTAINARINGLLSRRDNLMSLISLFVLLAIIAVCWQLSTRTTSSDHAPGQALDYVAPGILAALGFGLLYLTRQISPVPTQVALSEYFVAALCMARAIALALKAASTTLPTTNPREFHIAQQQAGSLWRKVMLTIMATIFLISHMELASFGAQLTGSPAPWARDSMSYAFAWYAEILLLVALCFYGPWPTSGEAVPAKSAP